MPTQESDLVRVLLALLSAGDATIREEPIYTPGYRPIMGYRLIVDSSVIIDSQHARTVRDACGIAIDDSVAETGGA